MVATMKVNSVGMPVGCGARGKWVREAPAGPAVRLLFRCLGCGRTVPAVSVGVDPRRLVCSSCGERNPEVVQEVVA